MTQAEEDIWCKQGGEYRDKFLGNSRVRVALRRSTKGHTLNNKQTLLNNCANFVIEIETTRKRLYNFPKFLASFSPALERQGISRVAQFVYHVDNYLESVYRFDQMVRRFFNALNRMAQRQRCSAAEIKSFNDAKNALIVCIEPIVSVRGNHTHIKAFLDDKILEMERWDRAGDFTTDPVDKETFKNSARNLLEIQRKRWKADIKGDLRSCDIQMGLLYEAADSLIWESHRKMR